AEGAQPVLAELPGLIPMLMLARWPPHALPAAGVVVLLPPSVLASKHMPVATRVQIGPMRSPGPGVVTEMPVPGGVHAVAPVMVDVHVTDSVMPAPAAATVPPPAPMPAPVRPDGEAELVPVEGVDTEAEVIRTPAPCDRRRIPERPGPIRIVVASAEDHERSRRQDHSQIAGRVARVHDVPCRATHVGVGHVVEWGAR